MAKTLTGKMCRLLLVGFAVAVLVFLMIFFIGNALMDRYFSTSDFIYNAETKHISELQAYVLENGIAADDFAALGKWAHRKQIQHFTVSRERVLIYDSSYSDTVLLGQTESESLDYNWQYFHTVTFSDGEADVYLYANYEARFYVLFYAVDAALSVAFWLILFIVGIRKEVVYIQRLNYEVIQISLGTLTSPIPVKGMDELGSLARGLDQMRLALIEKEQTEEKLRAEQDKLVLAMSHDLRTPLTGLTTFLDIAQSRQDLDECHRFVTKAYAKALQIGELSDQLFEFFLIHAEQPVKLEKPEAAEYALGEYLSELCGLLETNGFRFSVEQLSWEPVQIRISTDFIGRIIDNLQSNIKKYADPRSPIVFSSEYDSSSIRVAICNKPSDLNQYVKGTGIGLKNISSMMAQMDGSCEVTVKPDYFSVALCFPIMK